ncbi:tyrosine-type recombinase/integrase [Roseateles sp. BYS87W]|uniref:Tyrosine-type recombinase/integrase n=1 Tax=Pelomonas baiyunensis TaxID=3299026 RepID=A0ABW7H2D2_9BURK
MDFRFQGRRCREYTVLPDTPGNRKRLEKVLAKIEADIATGTFDYAATFPGSRSAAQPAVVAASEPAAPQVVRTSGFAPTFKDFTSTWKSEHQVEWRRSHIKVLDSTLDGHLLPEFGSRPVSSITKADVLTFRAKLADKPGRTGAKLSNKRINNILGVLRQIMAEAADRYDFISPCANVKALKIRKSDVQPFTLDEVQRMLAEVRADWRDYFLVRFFTGMRTGEAHGLKWKYVDFDRRLILIRETFVLGEDEYTKTDSSQRDIQMSQPVFEALKRQQEATGKRDYVFCNRAGQPIDNKNFSDRVYYPLLRHLGLERRPYQMRHTAATLWLASGEAPEWIARQLGHANTQMLFQVYSRYVPNLTRRDGSAMDRLLASRFASGNSASASRTESANDDGAKAQPPPDLQRHAA